MKYSHWELLLFIYQYNLNKDIKIQKYRCHKTLIKTCLKNNWVKECEDGTVEITNKGIEDAKEIAPLYERNMKQIGQTY